MNLCHSRCFSQCPFALHKLILSITLTSGGIDSCTKEITISPPPWSNIGSSQPSGQRQASKNKILVRMRVFRRDWVKSDSQISVGPWVQLTNTVILMTCCFPFHIDNSMLWDSPDCWEMAFWARTPSTSGLPQRRPFPEEKTASGFPRVRQTSYSPLDTPPSSLDTATCKMAAKHTEENVFYHQSVE